MRILAIDTSCDETATAVVENTTVLSNIIWSQASLHAKFGGVMPSLAQRQHEERIDWVINRSMLKAKSSMKDIDCIAVTVGPGLAIALGVGVDRAKKLAKKYHKPIIPVNHVEAHLLSPLAGPKSKKLKKQMLNFPALGLVVSGGTTILVLIEKIGQYKILAETGDDALGEALDKAARMLGLGYPGGAILEKIAKNGDDKKYSLPLPLANDRVKNRFSYSGLKTAFVRLVGSINNPSRQQIADLAASFQAAAFKHIENVLLYQIQNTKYQIHDLLLGGGVANNVELRKRLRKLCLRHRLRLFTPYSQKLMSDNAAMVGVTAYLKNQNLNAKKLNDKYMKNDQVDRWANLKI